MQTSDKLTINKKTSCFRTPFLILLHLIVVITVIGCGGNNGGVEPRIGDTIYTEKYALKDFTFENIDVTDGKNAFDPNLIEGTIVKNMVINGVAQ